jgi:hypothetical protein
MILDSPIISGSLTQQAGQIAEIPRYTAVSSSFLAASASFDARIDSIESTTASFSPRINALESFTASANATYVNVSGDSMSGDLTITGSLIVTDRITAQEFHTEYVSSSVVFQSGSTKFGDSVDDVHSFTGSVQIDGDVIASNLEGVFSSSAQITGSLGNYYIVSGTITQTTWDNIENKPLGIVSGSDQLTSSYDDRYVISGSITQTTWDNIENKPLGIVSGAAQVTESLDIRYRLVGATVPYSDISNRPTLISSSLQFTSSTAPFTGSFSGSFVGNGSLLTGLAAGAKFHTQSEAASTWTFIHNLSTQYPNVTVYGTNNNIILPQSITAINVDTLVLEFGTPVSGYATAGVGGIIEVNGRTVKQYFTSALEWRFEHNIGDRFINIQTFDTNYEKIIPQTIALTDTTSSLIVFPEATEGWVVGTIGGDLPAISSSYGGYTLQISQNAPYTASWVEIADVLVSNAVNLKYNAFTASVSNNSFEVINDGSSLMNIAIGSSSINNGTLTITADSFASDYAEDYTQLGTALVLKGDGIVSGSLVPAGNGIHNLGSVDNPWKELFVSTGSINLVQNGQIAYSITAESIVTTDTLSSGAINLTNSLPAGTISGSSQIVGILNPLNEFTTSTTARVSSLEEKSGSLATTGSNTFFGTQTFSGSVYIKENLIVQGSSSLQNITASAVDIGTNRIILNVDNPSVRYAGISVYDSGSTGGTGSLFWDSVENHWLYEHPSDSAAPYNSAILISGPKNEGNLGEELELVNNYIVKAVGGDHISSSAIYDDGSIVKIQNTTLNITGSKIGIGITNPSSTFHALVAEEQSGLNSVRIQGITNNKLLALGVNTDYTWIQSHGSVPLYINELGNNTIFNLSGGRVGIGMTNPTSRLNVLVDGAGNGDGITLGVGSQGDGIQIVQRYLSNRVVATLGQSNYSGVTDSAALRLYDVGGTETIRLSGKINVASFINSGNVGIGITNPQSSLHIIKALGNDAISIGESGTNTRLALGQESSYSGNYIDSRNIDLKFKSFLSGGTGGNIIFQTGDGSVSSRFRINTDGRVQVVGSGNQLTFDTLSSSNSVTMGALGDFEFRIRNARGTSSDLVLGNTNIDLNTANTLRLRINDTGAGTYTGPFSFSSSITTSGYHYSQGSTVLRKTLNITEGVTTTLLSFDQAGSYGHTGGGEILVVFVDPGSPWGVYVWKGLLTIRTVQFTGAYYGSNLSVISTNATLDGSFDVSATFTKTNGEANGQVRVRAVPSSGIGGTAYVYWNGLVTQGGNAY